MDWPLMKAWRGVGDIAELRRERMVVDLTRVGLLLEDS